MFEQGPTFPHGYHDKSNTVSAWSGYDDAAQWEANLRDPEQRRRLEESGWLPFVDIEYRYNSHGFRDDEFSHTDCGIALGCSFTEGVGVAYHQTWPKQLEKLVGYRVWNLGIGGTGIATCYRAMEYFVPKLKPRFVAMLDPPIARLEIRRANGGFTHLLNVGWENSDATSPRDQFVKHWFAQDFNWIHQHRVYIRAMGMLAHTHDIPFVHLYNGPICQPDTEYQKPQELFPDNESGILDRARDLAHAGPKTLSLVAQKLYDQLRKIQAV